MFDMIDPCEEPDLWASFVPPEPADDDETADLADESESPDGCLDALGAREATRALLEFEESLESVRLAGLDANATLREVTAGRDAERRVQARQLLLVTHWADLHAVLSRPDARGKGRERLVRLGGEGTPEVAEFAPVELGTVLGVSHFTVSGLLADALDLRHRFPLLWSLVQGGLVDVWLARRTVQEARSLSKEAAALVDAQVAALTATLTWSRLKKIVKAAVLAADPPQAVDDAARAASEVGAKMTPDLDHGYATMIIKAAAGDLQALNQALGVIARASKILGHCGTIDQRRAEAAGIIANPKTAQDLIERAERVRKGRLAAAAARRTGDFELAKQIEQDFASLLLPGTPDPDPEPEPAGPGDPPPATTSPAPAQPSPAQPHGPHQAGSLDRKPVTFGTTVLYFHISQETVDAILTGGGCAAAGVVRMEDIGPVIADQVKRWLGHANVVLKPVINLPGLQPVDQYETPGWMSEAIGLQRCADSFPCGTSTSRHQDNEHTIPYLKLDEGGSPGQTDPAKMSKMTRLYHRVKTFGGWTVRQVRPGGWLYRSPHGYYFIVDPLGTTPLGKL